MPAFTPLSQAEVDDLKKRRMGGASLAAKLSLEPYFAIVDTVEVGAGGRITPDEGETSRLVKRRLTIAARQRGVALKYRKKDGDTIVFERIDPNANGVVRRPRKKKEAASA